MPTFEQGDVPFPYTDKATRQRRPALVVSDGQVGDNGELLWVAMITSAENRPSTDDFVIQDLGQAGLPASSVVRPCKIATIEARHAERLGKLPDAAMAEIAATIVRYIGRRDSAAH